MLQRILFVWLAFVMFHLYLRKWFAPGVALAGVCMLAAILPYTYISDLQESSSLLMLTFVVSLWALRDGPSWLFAVLLLLGALNNETSLMLPTAYFASRIQGFHPKQLWATGWRTLAVAAPAFAYTLAIRYITRDRPHLGAVLQLGDNLRGVWLSLGISFFDYYRARYLFIFLIFNVLWIYAFLGLKNKPRFVQASLFIIPAFIIPHFITGVIFEVRQMIPLGFVIIPAAFFWLFPKSDVKETEPSKEAGSAFSPASP